MLAAGEIAPFLRMFKKVIGREIFCLKSFFFIV